MGRSRYTNPHIRTFITFIVLNNPPKCGYMDEAKHWGYSSTSARDYEGINGLLEIERAW